MQTDKVIAVDCGGTNLRVAVMDANLKIIAVRRTPTVVNDPLRLYTTIKGLIDQVAKEANIPVIAIGMSICGTVTHNAVGRCGNLGIEDGYDFESLFRNDYPNARLKIANDANCSALVESMYGATVGLTDSAFVTLSSGIGFGLVHNGEMIDLPMEGGRLITSYKGKYYELEYLLSGNGIVHLCALNGVEIPSSQEFFNGIRAKNAKFLPIYEQWIQMLGIWFANLQLLFNCEGYAVSGGVMKSKDVFLDDLQEVANEAIACWHLHPIVLKDAAFRQDVGIVAAGSLALHELSK